MRTPEQERAERLLDGLENGGMASDQAAILAEDIDPVLIHTIVTFLRAVYPAADPAASSVLDRVVALTARRPSLVRKSQEGADDPITQWFESEHDYGEFRGRGLAMLELIVDKLES